MGALNLLGASCLSRRIHFLKSSSASSPSKDHSLNKETEQNPSVLSQTLCEETLFTLFPKKQPDPSCFLHSLLPSSCFLFWGLLRFHVQYSLITQMLYSWALLTGLLLLEGMNSLLQKS